MSCNSINNPSMKIARGSTTSISFVLGRDASEVDVISLVFRQQGSNMLEKTKEDGIMFENTVSFTLSQTETLSFIAGRPLSVQLRYKVDEHVPATPIFTLTVCDVLKEVEI